MQIHSRHLSDCIDNDIDEVIDRYAPMVYRIAFARMRSRHDADDVFQEVFIRYITNDKPFKSEEHKKAWLIRVSVNCCNKALGSAWYRRTQPLGDESVAIDIPDDSRELYEALMKLPSKYRVVIYLFYYEDMPVEKIASALRLSPGNVRVQLSRARGMLKEHLKGGSLDEREGF